MSTVLNAPLFVDVPKPPFVPGPAGTHITIRGLTKYFAGWPLSENFDQYDCRTDSDRPWRNPV